MSISMQKFTGNWGDFVYLPFDQIPHLDTSKAQYKKYEKRDRDWIEENYLQLSIRVPLVRTSPFTDRPR